MRERSLKFPSRVVSVKWLLTVELVNQVFTYLIGWLSFNVRNTFTSGETTPWPLTSPSGFQSQSVLIGWTVCDSEMKPWHHNKMSRFQSRTTTRRRNQRCRTSTSCPEPLVQSELRTRSYLLAEDTHPHCWKLYGQTAAPTKLCVTPADQSFKLCVIFWFWFCFLNLHWTFPDVGVFYLWCWESSRDGGWSFFCKPSCFWFFWCFWL